MGKARLLIVEDDIDISNMLKIYFASQGYDVETALRGQDALEKTRQSMPHLIVLDIMLPDINGYEVCRILRTTTRTSHIPVIFLTQKDERSDRLQGLELGADDYITKPFDIDELKLRVQNAIARSERESLTDPQTGLPAGRMIEDQLRQAIRKPAGWAFLDVRINHFEPFKNVYGFIAAGDVLRFAAMLLGEVIDELGTPNDFLGHAGGDNFVILTAEDRADAIKRRLKERFRDEVVTHYNFMDRQQGYILAPDSDGHIEPTPLMTLAVGVVSPATHYFADIREITELAAEERRQDSLSK
ncbi:MAG TPA: diguanylate cyclase [Anaerolinea thermolimosa]|uniref:Diguanylate cyclase n=1 Tax=Anaerolinea thermolimosa TaxID=229919 RepID=A0A3D1JE92_9CHLR|nr:response regulator [Anaerolinea thermolimosa]GAP07338.1 response regulator receiver modulated diguanylate cyclase [Anaerolinea thermolimosa]HCE16899.1 diguanylate cyclase [Anaerolinea thermolimosa]